MQILGALAVVSGVVFLITTQKDDNQMAQLKQAVADFIRSDKQTAPVSEVLAGTGSRICMSYQDRQTVKSQLLPLFPTRAAEIDKLENGNDKSALVIAIDNGKELAVMTGRRNLVVGDKTYTLAVPENKEFGCFSYATAKLGKVENTLLLSGSAVNAVPAKPKQKKQPASPAKKAAPAPRNYGY